MNSPQYPDFLPFEGLPVGIVNGAGKHFALGSIAPVDQFAVVTLAGQKLAGQTGNHFDIDMITKKSFQKLFTRASFAGLMLTAGASAAFAQTNGTLTGTTTGYNYSTAPWVITGIPGTYPDGGGTATFNSQTGVTPGTLATGTTVTLDVSPTLSAINYNSPFFYTLSGTGPLNMAASGMTVNSGISPQGPQLSYTSGANLISAPITGGGTFGLTKTGAGIFTLSGANTYTGGTHFNGGIFIANSTALIGDAVFGAAGAGNGLSFNGGNLYSNVTGGLTSARDIFVDAGGGTLTGVTATTLSGNINGAGAFNYYGFAAAGTLTLTGANTFTGAFLSTSAAGTVNLSGTGSLASASSYDLIGAVNLNNTTTNVNNRLADTAPITLRGAVVTLTGNASTATAETAGAVTLADGINSITVVPNATAGASLNLASVSRTDNSLLFVRGTALGSAAPGTVNVATITSATAPTLVGGGGAAGSTTLGIVPYAIGNTSTAAISATSNLSSSFVTYDATNGFRPLAVAEYATTLGANATDNVRITTATVATAGVTVNSLLLAPATAAASNLSGGPINVTSGAFLYSPTASATGTVSVGLNFGAAEGVITNTSTLNYSGVISGSGGVTLSSPSSAGSVATTPITLTGASTYTGNTTLNGGTVAFSGIVPAAGNASVFGNSGTVVLNGGTNLAFLEATAATTLNRDVSVVGGGTNYIGTSTSGFTFTLNGNVNIQNNFFLYGNSATSAASAIIFNGVLSGPGIFEDTSVGYAILNGNNTYSGGTSISASTFVAGSDTAFGTGTISFNSSTGNSIIMGSGTASRTLANNFLLFSGTNTFGGTAPLTLTGGVNLNGSRTVAVTNTALTAFNGVVSNGAITKTGTGAVAFNSPTGNTFTGGFTTTTAAPIYVNNTSGSGLGTGAVNIGANSALAGSFTLAGTTSIAGRLSPGNTPGSLTVAAAGIGAVGSAGFNGALTLAATSSLYLEAASNISRDQINVGGLLTLNGTVFIATTGGFSFSSTSVIDFVDWSTISVGAVTFNVAGALVDPGYQLDTTFFTTDGTIRVIPVPEPTTLAFFGFAGALGLAGYVRRRRA